MKRDELRGSYNEGEENWMGMKERSKGLKKEDVGNEEKRESWNWRWRIHYEKNSKLSFFLCSAANKEEGRGVIMLGLDIASSKVKQTQITLGSKKSNKMKSVILRRKVSKFPISNLGKVI